MNDLMLPVSGSQLENSQFLELTNYQISVTPYFTQWLAEQQVSLALTNTLGHSLFLIGLKPNGELAVCECKFDRCMGLTVVNSNTLYMVTRFQIWRLENALSAGQIAETGADRIYLPQMAYTTGVLNIHDIAVDAEGSVVFVATRFNCLAKASTTKNFEPLWCPPFISHIMAPDHCHLNGLALHNGKLAYASSFSQTNTHEGWRQCQRHGGTITDIATNEIVVSGLSMPHSPRVYQGQLWVAQSGTGEFGKVDIKSGKFEPIVFGAGFLRGLAFWGNFAIVGSSKPRHSDFFNDLVLGERLAAQSLEPLRGLHIIDLKAGEIIHSLSLEGVQGEIYDVVVLPGVRRPVAISNPDDIQKYITVGFSQSL
ncbi:TIGR03032 family protein [Synechocystis sp. LKSZ1]|uniref:TIGR03032 family protein n=1 Tax=Synechocystis sp. LKSZ1 TaxID=3144951 RepID=UPI00336C0341